LAGIRRIRAVHRSVLGAADRFGNGHPAPFFLLMCVAALVTAAFPWIALRLPARLVG